MCSRTSVRGVPSGSEGPPSVCTLVWCAAPFRRASGRLSQLSLPDRPPIVCKHSDREGRRSSEQPHTKGARNPIGSRGALYVGPHSCLHGSGECTGCSSREPEPSCGSVGKPWENVRAGACFARLQIYHFEICQLAGSGKRELNPHGQLGRLELYH